MKGTIKNMPSNKTFCFIKGRNGAEYFLHRSNFQGHWDDLVADFAARDKEEDPIEVTFKIEDSAKGPRANNCRRLDFPND